MEVPITLPLLLLFLCVHFSSADTNIALNQPSWQSGTYKTGTSSKAFDGNTNPAFYGGSCTHTNSVDNPWLVVDLQYSRLVYRVDITNRGDGAYFDHRFRNARIGTSNTSPLIQAPALTNYDVCHTFAGPLGSGVTQGFYCGSTGRYLIIQLQQNSRAMHICEVQVFEKMFQMRMDPVVGHRLDGHSLSEPTTVMSMPQCAQQCVRNNVCSSFSYQPTSRTCQLISSTFDDEAASLGVDTAWTWYRRRNLF